MRAATFATVRDYPWVLVRLSTVGVRRLREVLAEAWRLAAPKRPGTKGKER